MPEYIEREALIHSAQNPPHIIYTAGMQCDWYERCIKEAPAADVAPVVRCKDCAKFEQKEKYYNGTPFGYCYHWYYEPGLSPNEVDGDDFCSYGERKEGADNG